MSAINRADEGKKFRANRGGFEIVTGRTNDDAPPEGMRISACI